MRALVLLLLTPFFLLSRLDAESLTLDQAMSEASAHSPAVKQARAALAQAHDRKLAAYAAFLPKLNLSAGESTGGPYDPDAGTFGGGGQPGTSLGLNSSINLFRGLGDLAALRQAEAALGTAEEDLKVSLAQAAYSVRSAWVDLLYAQQQLDLNSQTTKRREDNSAMVQLRFDVGSENKGSLMQTQAQSVQAEADTRSAQRAVAQARRALARAIGLDDGSRLEAQGEFPVPDEAPGGDDAKLAAGLPTVVIARLGLDAAKAALSGATAGFLPSLNASAGVNRSGDQWLPQDGSWSAGLSLSWNLFNGFSDLSNRSGADQALLAATAAYEDAQRQGADDLADARDSLANALDQLKVRDAVLQAARTRADISRAQYTQGLIGFQDWDQIESSLISAQQSSLNGRRDAALNGFAWQRALSIGWDQP